ncbi:MULTISPECIES: nitrogenase stabilizing/protective protein NifW [Acetobacter]|jgi:nitrogenase-stabilizing/protective protein|uniref:Nitrogenase-stabilizing/protective protein NifW n=1 Tax=Acetobacter lovaniensis TaxID=104100 RepID=A0A841QEI9_9PROT|nr:nitrogenase stabilizing/protective protein NifW [Acetobacter lovaniensis]MBB6456684.1 nitrogenase-stabilizing/protective protein [Acetobacter lovaniensis]MCI1795451.1 nitrogenase stabilizing/protective protein NifW [Acetobacter lovaniensis]MCP1239270.1 nitrogenase stabilizing/protective protein NifW [Acetobacter lovaniensis]NHN81497.1 nitrogenase stabilizing/protective protein NifW [Acetobacter lovaniensis]GBQ65502.1 nitrogen fixation protein NifW [Acetobacter lovaniensis NRIC 0474]
MQVLQELRRLSAAEEFFEQLGVPYDPTVLNVARLHILRRMRSYLDEQGLDTELDEAMVRERCRTLLSRAYQDFVVSTPIAERSFKVHRDAIRPSRQIMVGLEDLTVVAELTEGSKT